MAKIFANYLQVITKDTLENQVGLGIYMARFAFLRGIIGAHPKQSLFQFPLQLGATFLVTSIGILGVTRRYRIPLATDLHTRTGVNSRSSNSSKSNNSSSKVGHPELVQSNTYLRLTQDRRMQGTMKNLTSVVGYVHPSHLPMQCWGPRGGGRLGTTEAQSSFNHFTQHALENAWRQGTMQCQEACRMATDTIILPDEGGMQGVIANARALKASKIFAHFFRCYG